MQNLDTLKTEIEKYLEEQNFAIFRGFPRVLDTLPIVHWDCERFPNYKAFLQTAKAAGATLVVYHQHEFTTEQIDSAMERLENGQYPHEDFRTIETRLMELRAYDGFTCALELSFDHQGRIYVFDLHTEWYDDFQDLLDDLNLIGDGLDDDDERDNPMSGYFSKN
jgi:hypothetical protein